MKNWKHSIIGILAIIAVIFTACNQSSGAQQQTTTAEQTQTTAVQTQTAADTSGSNPLIINRNVSEFTGTWVDIHGQKMQIKANGRLQVVDNNLYYFSDDYEADVYIFPAGVEFVHWSGTVRTDTSEDRVFIQYGSERTPTNDDVFYREVETSVAASSDPYERSSYEQILNGDLSEFGGVWVNIDGRKAHLLSFGVFVFEGQEGNYADDYVARDFHKQEDGSYVWGVYQGEGGTWVTLYPAGTEVKENLFNQILQTDSTKVRITRGFVGDNTDVFYMEGQAPLFEPIKVK